MDTGKGLRRGCPGIGREHDQSLGTGERNEAQTRAGAIKTANRPQITRAPEAGPKQALHLSTQGWEQGHTPEQSQARGQDSDDAAQAQAEASGYRAPAGGVWKCFTALHGFLVALFSDDSLSHTGNLAH